MNIFLLDTDPIKAAQYHNDKHVVKMITETCQILSTALQLSPDMIGENFSGLYKITHTGHPCVKWCFDKINFHWVSRLLAALIDEYDYRYPDRFENFERARFLSKKFNELCGKWFKDYLPLRQNAMEPDWNNWPLAMPDEYKWYNPVAAYRNYYIGGKNHLATWTKREQPNWYKI